MSWSAAGFMLYVLLLGSMKVCPRTPEAAGSCMVGVPTEPDTNGGTDLNFYGNLVIGSGYQALTPEAAWLAWDARAGFFREQADPSIGWLDGMMGRIVAAPTPLSITERRRLMAGLPVTISIKYRDAAGHFSTGQPSSRVLGLDDSPGLLSVVLARQAR